MAPVRDETLLDDNAVEFSIQIAPEKIRVLYIDGYPRWEYRFLKELLKRSDENISAQMFLLFRRGRQDVMGGGDLGLQEGLRILDGLPERPGPKDLEKRAEVWAPLRSVASWVLWRLVST